MSIFAKDIVSNSDSIVLREYHLVYDIATHTDYLYEKDHGMYPRKTFVHGQSLWNEYVDEAMGDVLKIEDNIEKFINEGDFLLYIKNSPLTNKLKFRGETWYEKRYLWDVFDAYNEHVVEMHLKWRHKQLHKKSV